MSERGKKAKKKPEVNRKIISIRAEIKIIENRNNIENQ